MTDSIEIFVLFYDLCVRLLFWSGICLLCDAVGWFAGLDVLLNVACMRNWREGAVHVGQNGKQKADFHFSGYASVAADRSKAIIRLIFIWLLWKCLFIAFYVQKCALVQPAPPSLAAKGTDVGYGAAKASRVQLVLSYDGCNTNNYRVTFYCCLN